jgi:hypothetical protein
MKKIRISALFFGLGLLLFSGSAVAETITSFKCPTPTGPTIDGVVDDLWANAQEKKITVAGGTLKAPTEVLMKSLYTDKDIFFLFRWKDDTESLNRMYEYDGTKWNKVKGNEDRFNLLWNIDDSIANFNSIGCTTLCHSATGPDGKSYLVMSTNADNEKGDLWHWKAQRTNPVGQADDQWIQNKVDFSGHEATGRKTDKKESGGYSKNFDKDKARPKFAFKSAPSDVRILLKSDAVEVTDATTFKAGDRVPREVVSKFVGSRGDIEAKGVWKDGVWTLEMRRARDTGNADDIQFKDLTKTYYFGIAVHDNSGGEKHGYSAAAVQLNFELPKATPAPTPAPEKGICGPATLLAIATLPLYVFRRRR